MSIAERLSVALADRYRVERELGAGGMANVFLAEDLKHKRKVALKVLKPELAAVLGAERFVQEITTTASLSHPHILPLFDSGTTDGFLYYVMPFIEGETLRGKLDRETQLGVDEAVRIASEVADALDYAHRHGVIHRDIKPENILLHDGRPMVADFGIALAVSAAAGGRMTETGLSLGTPHYMSPEQATAAKEITARSDIYSLGSVLYEMLTGAPPHVGASAQQIIMKIVTEEAAPVTSVRRMVPPNVADAVARALEKLPADRFETARAFATALGDPSFRHAGRASIGGSRATGTVGSAATRWDFRARILAASVALLLIVTALLGLGRIAGDRERVAAPVVAFTLLDSVGPLFVGADVAGDGTIAFVRDSAIRMRHPGAASDVALAGAEGAVRGRLLFSPDGRQLAYLAESRVGSRQLAVRRIDARGGTAITLWTGPTGETVNLLSWSADGWINIRRVPVTPTNVVSRVRETGGEPEDLLSSTAGIIADFEVVPGTARAFLCVLPMIGGAPRVILFDLAMRDTALVRAEACSPRWSPSGHLLVATLDGAVDAIPFDPKRLRSTGPPVRVLENVAVTNGGAWFSLSLTGTLIYRAGPPNNTGLTRRMQLAFLDSSGTIEPIPLAPTDHPDASLSPDGQRLAYTREDQVWVYDLDFGTHVKVTTTGSQTHNPVWSPDGRSIAYRSLRAEQRGGDVYVQRVAGDTAAVHVGGTEAGDNPSQWLSNGSILSHTNRDIFATKVDPPGGTTPLLQADWIEQGAKVSPDGKWIAYSSGEGGAMRVTVRSWPDLRKKSIVSEGPSVNDSPLWSRDSRTLYYRDEQQRLMAASLAGTDSIRVTVRRVLADGLNVIALWDLHPDGRRFLVFVDATRADSTVVRSPPQLIVVTNWLTELRARLRVGAGAER